MADAFAARAADWDANPVRAALGRAFYAEVLRAAPELGGKTVLEFGCGTGALGLRLAADHGARVVFVDTSPAMLEVLADKLAAQGLADAQVLLGDIATLALPEASVDLVVSLMALHHVPDVAAVLTRFRRLLKPGGLALLGDLLPEDGGFHGLEPAAHNGFDPAALARQLSDAGFLAQPHRVFHTIRKPDAAGVERAYPVFLLAAGAA